MSLERITPPLIVPMTSVRTMKHHALCSARWRNLSLLAEWMNVRRPGKGETPCAPTVNALLEALATSGLGVVRMDDPERRIVTVEDIKRVLRAGAVETTAPHFDGPVIDRRCPDDWKD